MVTLWGADGPVGVKELSRRLKLDPPTLSPLLKRLQTAGLVERQRDTADERSLLVSLTEAARTCGSRPRPYRPPSSSGWA